MSIAAQATYENGSLKLDHPLPLVEHQRVRVVVEPNDKVEASVSGSGESFPDRFSKLAMQWRNETQWLSSTSEIAMHPTYQAIIGMGEAALPLILEDLRQKGGHWYWALKAISREDPVPPGDRGAVQKMRDAWLKWGVEKGLISA